MERRSFLARTGVGVAGLAGFAGCTSGNGDGSSTGTSGASETTGTDRGGTTTGATGATSNTTLTVATYPSFTGEETAGTWLKQAFEKERSDVTVEFVTPNSGVNQYIQRKRQGAAIDADVYVGLNTGELVRADEKLDGQLFVRSVDRLENAGGVKSGLQIDPDGRAVPYDTGYISLVYDEGEVESPGTFDALLESKYENDLITENAQQSDTGRAFLLWTIKAKGADGYLDYWSKLADNGVRILSDWEPAYKAYTNGEAPMVVSYSTDQVYNHGSGVDMSRHRIGFLDDQGYANPEAMAVFADASNSDVGMQFMDFALTEKAQAQIAVRNVQFPAVEGVDPGEEFSKYALEPPEAVTFTYDELAGSVGTWIEQWARRIAGR
ncbi:MAG: thiamine ABC transporter substrate binding subunit [Haloferacaceae archaeon]